jgi:hypothetical protein
VKEIRAALYARVSSEQQVSAHTVESQLAALSERAQADGVPIPLERQFVDDGHSGATLVRPALDQLRDLVLAGVIDRIYVHSPDRLASADIVKELGEMEGRRWPEWKRGKPISQHQLASLLRPFGVKPKQFKEEGARLEDTSKQTSQMPLLVISLLTDRYHRYLPRPARVLRQERNRYRPVSVPDRKYSETRVQWARYRWYRIKRGYWAIWRNRGEI